MKKYVGSLAVCATLLFVSTTAMAQEGKNVKEIEKVEVIDGELVEVFSQVISIPEEPEAAIGVQAAGDRHASISNHKPFLGNWYTVASSSADYTHDQMGARARLYNKSGTLWANDDQSLENVKSITATARSSSNQINFNGAYSIGDHTFKRSGYKDTTLETKKYW